jgi:hypothetical protein
MNRRAAGFFALILAMGGCLTLFAKSFSKIGAQPETSCVDYICHYGGNGDAACATHSCDACWTDGRCALVAAR